jgi:uncharacterized MnhB-related membrane protein
MFPDTLPTAAFDLILAPTMVTLGWAVLMSKDLFRSVMLFIVFGLLMALVWVRLGAPDIALAEAAIGTGLTAALLLEAVNQIQPRSPDQRGSPTPDTGMHDDPDSA